MMQATEFELRNRWWFFGAIFGASFFFLAFDHTPVSFAASLNILWVYAGLAVSPLLSWLAGVTMRKRGQALSSASKP